MYIKPISAPQTLTRSSIISSLPQSFLTLGGTVTVTLVQYLVRFDSRDQFVQNFNFLIRHLPLTASFNGSLFLRYRKTIFTDLTVSLGKVWSMVRLEFVFLSHYVTSSFDHPHHKNSIMTFM